MSIYDNIDTLCRLNHIRSRRELARRIKVNEGSFSSIFTRKPDVFPQEIAEKIADFFGVSPHELYTGLPQAPLEASWEGQVPGIDYEYKKRLLENKQYREQVWMALFNTLAPQDIVDLIRIGHLKLFNIPITMELNENGEEKGS